MINMKYKVIRSRRKSIAIKVIDGDNILVKAPLYCSDKEVKEVLDKYQDRINKQVKAKQELENVLYYLGKSYSFKVELGTRNKVVINENEIIITHTLSKTYQEVYDAFLKKQAILIINKLLDECLLSFPDLAKPTFNVRKVKSKWGSCSFNKQHLMFNTVLIMTPYENIKEVVFHELCHFYHHNHSKDFHALLEKVCPNHRILERRLKEYGFLLS